ncbi:PREDICTED: uncharacterized protein LOC105599071 [Cercocebus atys]|uniref:uncharacterized protein LOC105599071 n=1 Tax=Cercocebus atys TaxID=9531 RepID=UPI0005F53CDB|nr:PREDICTED: uncharacterized protein LOC105599071 [Cercocebus atys]
MPAPSPGLQWVCPMPIHIGETNLLYSTDSKVKQSQMEYQETCYHQVLSTAVCRIQTWRAQWCPLVFGTFCILMIMNEAYCRILFITRLFAKDLCTIHCTLKNT